VRFADPAWLLLLPALAAWLWLRRRRPAEGAYVGFPDCGALAAGRRGLRARWLALPGVLRGAGLALLVVALARPQATLGLREVTSQGVNVLVALDVSGSMKAEDFRPRNRLHVAKRVVADFVARREGDRVGLVVFAGKAFSQVPLTTDRGVLLAMLDRVEIGMLPDGTAIGTALATALNHVKDVPARSSVVVLLTDGVNNTGRLDPLTAAEAARALGVRVYTIGVGTRGTAPFLVEDPIVGRRYVELPVTIDEEVLRRIADQTGGRYFRATDPRTLAAVLTEVDRLERTEIRVRERVQVEERFRAVLVPGVALVAAGLLLGLTAFRTLP
jgi:Ca-activated chloride channel family protein